MSWARSRWLALAPAAGRSAWAREQLARCDVGAALATEWGWEPAAKASAPEALDRSRSAAERTARGQVFTPAPLADALCALADVASRSRDPRVLDPACGDGGLLVAATRTRVQHGWNASDALAAVIGVDSDAVAVFAARAALVEWALANGAEAEIDVRCADSLVGPAEDVAGRVGTVLANPPFLEAKRLGAHPGLARRLRAEIPGLEGAFDLYLAFCFRALEQITADGRIAIVLPNKVLMARYAREFRDRVDGGPIRLRALVDASHTRPRLFESTGVYPVLLELGPNDGGVRCARADTPDGLGQLEFHETSVAGFGTWFVPRRESWPILAPLLEMRPLRIWAVVRSACSFHRRGLREQYVTPEQTDETALPYLGGPSRTRETEIRPYELRWAGWWIRYDAPGLAALGNPLPSLANFLRPKVVLCQHGPRVRAWVDEHGRFVTKDVYPVAWPIDPALSVWDLAALLNSTVFTALYNTLFHGVTCGSETLHYLPTLLSSVPTPGAAELAGAGVFAREAQAGVDGAWAAADRLVARAYGLDDCSLAALVRVHLERVGAETPGPTTSPRSPRPR